jgi:HlyD family secretion protein
VLKNGLLPAHIGVNRRMHAPAYHRLATKAGLGLALILMSSQSNAADEQVYTGMAVSVIRAEHRCVNDILQVSGVFTPKAEIQVRPDRERLKVSQVLVEAGDTVATGQILARLSLQQPNAPAQVINMRSPGSGVAISTSAIVGSYTSPSATDPMFRIIVDGELELSGQALAADLPRLHVNQVANVKIQGLGQLSGRITTIDKTIDAMTQLGTVRIMVALDPRLRPGLFASADIIAGEACGVVVPLSAILYESESAVVQVVRGDHVETHRVTVGLLDQGVALVNNGIIESDLVIARAGGFLRDGDRVRPFPLDLNPKH